MIKIIPIFHRAREIKPDGADIEEILQCYSIEEIREHILGIEDEVRPNKPSIKKPNLDYRKNDKDMEISGNNNDPDFHQHDSDNGYPFQILGIADDNRAYFLDYEKRVWSYFPTQINSEVLQDLGDLDFFESKYGYFPKREDWAHEINAVRKLSKRTDFDIDNIRGRGAWRDSRGNISYHDGEKTKGKYDENWTFIRKPKKSIGIDSSECGPDIRRCIMEITKQFSFKTKADTIRLLSWAVLAPFSGALLWRPAALVTGESGSGKSTVIEKIVLPLALASFGDGGSSTEPGLRQFHRQDSCGIVIDEAERKKKGARERLENIFTMMRTSTSDNSPSSFKGTAGGSAMVFKMRCMFCFVAIDATIEDTANDNRIVKVDFKKVDNYSSYVENMKDIQQLLSKKNCDGIRAFTWNNLEKIIRLASRLELIIQKETGQDARFAAGESILLAANIIVWENIQSLDNSTISEYVHFFYRDQTMEEKRDETDEMVQTLLDETIIFGSDKSPHSMRELLIEMKRYLDDKHYSETGEFEKINQQEYEIIKEGQYRVFKRAVEQCGLTVHKPTRELAISHPHKWVMKTLNLTRGYNRQLIRHKNVVEYRGETCPTMTIDSGTKRAVIIGKALEYNNHADNPDDKPF